MSVYQSLRGWLRGRGLTHEEADLWGDFIIDALTLIQDGHTVLRSPAEWASFLGGCAGAIPTEPDVTSGLGDRMRGLWIDAPMDSGRHNLLVAYEQPTPGDDAHGKHKTKADLCIERKFEAGYAARLAMEAKSLKTQADLTTRYLGKDGIGCFLERTPPYTTEVVGGMLGYAFVDHAAWLPKLLKAVVAISPLRQDMVEADAGRVVVASDHSREEIGLTLPITVLHSVLNVEAL